MALDLTRFGDESRTDLFPQIGWLVGYVEAKNGVWFFAMNLDIQRPEDARYRREITLTALKLKGIL